MELTFWYLLNWGTVQTNKERTTDMAYTKYCIEWQVFEVKFSENPPQNSIQKDNQRNIEISVPKHVLGIMQS